MSNRILRFPTRQRYSAIGARSSLIVFGPRGSCSSLWIASFTRRACSIGKSRKALSARREIIIRLMPRMVFYMSTVSAVTTTAGFVLASRLGLFDWPAPHIYWVWAALAIVIVMTIQGFGFLLPTNLRVYFELRKPEPDMPKIQRLMRFYIKTVASQAIMQFTIIFIMAKFATGA